MNILTYCRAHFTGYNLHTVYLFLIYFIAYVSGYNSNNLKKFMTENQKVKLWCETKNWHEMGKTEERFSKEMRRLKSWSGSGG